MTNEETQIYQLNKIISEKNEEILSKDKLISSLKQQITSLQNSKSQSEKLRREAQNSEEKMNTSEMENCSFISEKLKELSDSESKLRSNLILKDKILYDYNNTIKQHENSICMIKRQLIEKESLMSNIKHEMYELSNKFKSSTFELSEKDAELINLKDTLGKKVSDLTKEKESLEAKNIENKVNLNNLSKVNSDLVFKNRVLEKDLSSEKNLNYNNKNIIDELTNCHNQNKEELVKLRDINNIYLESEKYLQKIKLELQTELVKNKKLSDELHETTEKYKHLKVKYSGENTIENLQSSKEFAENENINLKETIDHLNQINQSNSINLKSLNQILSDFTESLNSEFKNISQWIEIYLGSYFDNDVEITQLPITINKTLKENTKLDELKQVLSTTRIKINEEFIKLDKNNKILKYEIEQNMKNQEKSIDEITELKKINVESNQINKETLSKLKKYEAIYEKIKNFYQKSQNNDSNKLKDKPTIEEIETDVLKLLGVCELNLNNNAEDNSTKDYQNFKEEFLKEYSNSRINNVVQKRDEEISLLKKELEFLKKEISSKNNLLNSANHDRNHDSSMLEKRISNLLHELELKEIQITSQDQMINRRNRELEEYRNRNDISSLDKSYNSKQKTKTLDLEKEKIIRDNKTLFNENNDLKEQLKSLIKEIPEINNEKYENLLKELQQNLNICQEEIKNKDVLIRQLLNENHYYKNELSNHYEENLKTDKSQTREISQEVKGLRSKIRKQYNK